MQHLQATHLRPGTSMNAPQEDFSGGLRAAVRELKAQAGSPEQPALLALL